MSAAKQVQGIDRREAIRRVTAMLGGVVFIGGSDLATVCERVHSRVAASRAQIGAFTAQDIALLDEVADTILPETKTPGAKAAHTGAFMAVMVTDTYDDGQQARPDDPVFGPWHDLFAVPDDRLAAEAPTIVSRWQARPPAQINALVIEALDRYQRRARAEGSRPREDR